MFTVNLEDYKIKQAEMIGKAKAYHLEKLAAGRSDLISGIKYALGKFLIYSGRQLLSLAGASR